MNTINPLFSRFGTPLETPPFSKIKPEHFVPAVQRAIDLANIEIDKISHSSADPTFANTIEALERTGAELNRALDTFYPLHSAIGSPEIDEAASLIAPMVSRFYTSMILNRDLWNRVRIVYDNRDKAPLTVEQRRLLDKTYDSFYSSGARLEGEQRQQFSEISSRLSELSVGFSNNVARELSSLSVTLSKADLEGLPDYLVEQAAERAHQNGKDDGSFVFTLDQPTYFAFMRTSRRRDLREHFWRLYTGRNIHGDNSNIDIVRETVTLRQRLARLLGYENYAAYSLHDTMAKQPYNVIQLLDLLHSKYSEPLRRELESLLEFARTYENNPHLMLNAWDYSYYSDLQRKHIFDFDPEQLRPYFELNSTVKGIFDFASTLYNITIRQRDDIETYHPDVKVYEVTDNSDNRLLGLLYTDFFPRPEKRPGAWMTEFAGQHRDAAGQDHRPLVSIVTNFTPPTPSKPSLLSPDEVRTLLHEFGHALHGLFADSTYASLSGTSVARDFVELPSQFNENFLIHPEFLNRFAKHYQTGQPIPESLIKSLTESDTYGAAYRCIRQLAFGYLDMAWHTSDLKDISVADFENHAIRKLTPFPIERDSLISPQFSHIFSGGYSAGYYSYKWAEVLDADAFAFYSRHGIVNPEEAQRFRKQILSKGASEDPQILYESWRGCPATVDALLRRDGIDN